MEEHDFEEMRSQIAILKEKLDNQDIVNERLMHNVINSKTDSIKRPMIISILCAVVVIFTSPILNNMIGTSWAFVAATDILMIYCMVREYLFKYHLNSNTLMSSNLLEVANQMALFKKSYKQYTLSNIFILLPVWLVWLIYEVFMSQDNQIAWSLTISMIIGFFIGGGVGLSMYIHIQHTATDIIQQIEE